MARVGAFGVALFATFYFLIMVLPEFSFAPGLPVVAGCLILLGVLWRLPYRLQRPGWKTGLALALAIGLGLAGFLFIRREEAALRDQIALLRFERLAIPKDGGIGADDDLGRDLAELREFDRREAAIRRLMPVVSKRRPGFGRAVGGLVEALGIEGIPIRDGRFSVDRPIQFCATFLTGPLDLSSLPELRVALRLEREQTEKAEAARGALLKEWKEHSPLSTP